MTGPVVPCRQQKELDVSASRWVRAGVNMLHSILEMVGCASFVCAALQSYRRSAGSERQQHAGPSGDAHCRHRAEVDRTAYAPATTRRLYVGLRMAFTSVPSVLHMFVSPDSVAEVVYSGELVCVSTKVVVQEVGDTAGQRRVHCPHEASKSRKIHSRTRLAQLHGRAAGGR